jgi:hypothetical protein
MFGRVLRYTALAFGLIAATPAASRGAPIVINFDDVTGSGVDITLRYASLGVRLDAIANPFPLSGPFPGPLTLPAILGGVTTWTDPFPSATSPTQVAVAALTPQTEQPGDGGILISFGFDVSSVSVVGNDLGFNADKSDDESVTLTAYDASGNVVGSVYSTVNLPGDFDQTPASITHPGMRYVAFNYTDSVFGFYAMDDLQFTRVPEPSTGLLLLSGSVIVGLIRSGRNARQQRSLASRVTPSGQ